MIDFLKGMDEEIHYTQLRQDELIQQIRDNKHYLDKWNSISAFQNESQEDRRTKFSAYLDGLEAEREFDFDNLGAPSERPLPGSTAFLELSYELRFSAHLEDLLHFITKLDKSTRLLRVDKLEVTRSASGYRQRFATAPTGTKPLTVLVVVTIPTIKSEMTPLETSSPLP